MVRWIDNQELVVKCNIIVVVEVRVAEGSSKNEVREVLNSFGERKLGLAERSMFIVNMDEVVLREDMRAYFDMGEIRKYDELTGLVDRLRDTMEDSDAMEELGIKIIAGDAPRLIDAVI